jgi:hypothetical protein
MDKTLEMQMQIRQNADEISSTLKDISSWEKNMKKKEKNKQKDGKNRPIPSRSGGGTVPLRSFSSSKRLSLFCE